MIKFLFFSFLLSSAHAFTFNNNFGAAFVSNRVKVYIAGDTTCSNADMTVYELEEYIKNAIKKFWNRIPTSSLELIADGFSDAINNINHGQLCAPVDENCLTEAGGSVIGPVEEIIIGCNDNVENFSANNILAVTIPNNFSGRKIKGSVVLINNRSGTSFRNLSQADKQGVIAHEIGHAIGLGHTDDKAAMMYYRTVDLRKSLGQDDIDGVSYLYPKKFDACGLYAGTTGKPTSPFWQVGLGLFLFIGISKILKLLYRAKARSAL